VNKQNHVASLESLSDCFHLQPIDPVEEVNQKITFTSIPTTKDNTLLGALTKTTRLDLPTVDSISSKLV